MIQDTDFNALVDELASAIAKKLLFKLKEEVNTELKRLVISLNATAEGQINAELGTPAVTTVEPSVPLKRTPEAAPVSEVVSELEKVTEPEEKAQVVAPESFSITDNSPVYPANKTSVETTEASEETEHVPYVALTSENMTPDAFMKGLQLIADSALVTLPEAYVEAIAALNKKDQKTARIFLQAMNPRVWIDMIEGPFVYDVEDMMDTPIPDPSYRRYLNDYVRSVFEKIYKQGQKIQRSKDISAANLKRMAEAREKRRLLAERQLAKKNEAEAKRKAACIEFPCKEELYIPKVEKKLRKKIIIVGLLQAQQGLINTEFGNTFIMDMIESSGGIAKLTQVNKESGKMVFVMADFISHSHVDQIDKECLYIVKGGMTSIRESLSSYAKECYPA